MSTGIWTTPPKHKHTYTLDLGRKQHCLNRIIIISPCKHIAPSLPQSSGLSIPPHPHVQSSPRCITCTSVRVRPRRTDQTSSLRMSTHHRSDIGNPSGDLETRTSTTHLSLYYGLRITDAFDCISSKSPCDSFVVVRRVSSETCVVNSV